MSLKSFLKSKAFFFNLFLIVIFFVGVTWITMQMLSRYTHHGESISIPYLKGYTESELQAVIRDQNLRYKIIDSAFVENAVPGSVIDQVPEAGYKAKRRRTVYVTIAAFAPEKNRLPKVVDSSLREAKSRLENAGFVVGKVEYRPSEFQNLVLSNSLKGKKLPKDTVLEKGSIIDLVVGKGLSDETTIVPDLRGLLLDDAKEVLFAQNLTIGVFIYDDSFENLQDSLSAKVWKQIPAAKLNAEIELGASIDVWLTIDEVKLEKIEEQ